MTPEEQKIAEAAATSPDALAKMASDVYGFDVTQIGDVCGFIGAKLAYRSRINQTISQGLLAYEELK